MDNLILDEIEPEDIEGLPRKQKYLIARIILIIYIVFSLLSRVYYTWYFLKSMEVLELSIFGVKILLDVFLVYYLVVHFLMEQKKELSKPKFQKSIIRIALFLLVLKLFIFGVLLLNLDGGFELNSSFYFLITIFVVFALIAIFIRELAYLQWLGKANRR